MSIKHHKLLLFLIIKKGIDFLVIFFKNDFEKLIIPIDRTPCSAYHQHQKRVADPRFIIPVLAIN